MAKLVTFIEKEFILGQIQKTGAKIQVFGTGKTVSARVKSFDKECIHLSGIAKELETFKPWESVSIFLAYQSQRATFHAKVRKVGGADMVVSLPESFLKAPQRKAIRVPPPRDLKLEFYMQSERIRLEVPESSEYSDIEMPSLSAGFDPSSISRLLDSFKDRASTMYSKSGLVMFSKSRSPSTIEERLIADLGRTLLVTSTQSPLPAADPYPEGRIITQAMADAFEGPSIFTEGSELERSRAAKSAVGVVSELYGPVLYYQYVVGYVYLMNDETRKACLDYKAVDLAWEFARILAYSLKANNYFKVDDDAKPDPYQPEVVNVSAGGCLLSLPKSRFKLRLKQGSVLDIELEHSGEALSVKGRVARHLEDRQNDYYGVAFLNADAAAVSSLRKTLYADEDRAEAFDESTFDI